MANTYSLDLEYDSSQYASIADASQTGLDLATTFTLECWGNFESLPPSDGNYRPILSKDTTGQRAYSLGMCKTSGVVKVFALVFNTTNLDHYTWNWSPTLGTWYHIALTCNTANASATTFEFFINGVSQGNGTAVTANNIATISNTTAVFAISGPANAQFHDGKVDDVRVWNDVRSQPEIDNNKSVELAGNETNLVGYWKLNNNYLDETSNNNDLTASGSPVFSTDVPFGNFVPKVIII